MGEEIMGSGPSGPQSCSRFKTIFGYYSLNFDRYENVNHNDFVRELARHRASSTLTWLGRHAPVVQPLATALHMSISCAILCAVDLSVDLAFGTFPQADATDVWARDPPEVSSLSLRR